MLWLNQSLMFTCAATQCCPHNHALSTAFIFASTPGWLFGTLCNRGEISSQDLPRSTPSWQDFVLLVNKVFTVHAGIVGAMASFGLCFRTDMFSLASSTLSAVLDLSYIMTRDRNREPVPVENWLQFVWSIEIVCLSLSFPPREVKNQTKHSDRCNNTPNPAK